MARVDWGIRPAAAVSAVEVAWTAHLPALFLCTTGVVMSFRVTKAATTATANTRLLDGQTCSRSRQRTVPRVMIRSPAFGAMPNAFFLAEKHLATDVRSYTHSPNHHEFAKETGDNLCKRWLLKLDLLRRYSHLPLRRVKLLRRNIIGHLVLSDHHIASR